MNAHTEDKLVEQFAHAGSRSSPGLSQRERRAAGQTVSVVQNLRRTRDLMLPRLPSGRVNLGEDNG